MTIPLLGIFDDWALLILRLVVALIFLVQGWAKIKHLKEFSGSFNTATKSRAGSIAAPIVAFLEFLGGLSLLIGFFTQIAALVLALLAALKLGWRLTRLSDEKLNLELSLLLFASLLVLTILGGGHFGVDLFLPQLPL